MLCLKQSTAVTVKVGPLVDATDGFTAETGLTISQADIRLSKNGGAFAQTNNAAGATHDENGCYGVPLDTTDTATLGTLKLVINESGARPVSVEFMVMPANAWDLLFGAVAAIIATRVNTAQAGAAGTITLDASASAVDDFYNDQFIYLTGGTGAGQCRAILDYNGTTKVATIAPNWATNPDNTSTFAVTPNADGLEANWTKGEALRVILGSAACKLSGAGTATEVFRDPNDGKDRITATVDASGNRTAITFVKTP